MSLPTVTDVRFEHHRPGQALGVKIERIIGAQVNHLGSVKVISPESRLVPWPLEQPLASRTRCSVSVRARQQAQQEHTAWSDPAILETGLLHRRDWSGQLISAPWAGDDIETPLPEDLFRKNFTFDAPVQSARLYITALGVYEAEINGTRVGDHFLAPGWTSYDAQLIYQTHDVTDLLSSRDNCLGVRVAEGWFKGRIGFEGGRRNIWGPRTAVLAQLEIIFDDGSTRTITTDDTWTVNKGPIQRSEIYDGELYDATAKVPGWSIPGFEAKGWAAVDTLPPIADTVQFHAGDAEPNKTGSVHLWDFAAPQLGDWLDPNASPHEPWKAVTDPPLVANAFLIYSLDAMSQIAGLLGKELDATRYRQEAAACRLEFAAEYVSPNSRLPSDTQTVYALAITFNLLTPAQLGRAGDRLAEIVRRNTFRVGTGFAGTPYICEALAQTGHSDVAYAMLTERACPSWLFPVTMGATTMWERWDSMRPDGSVNPGDMTSFNHYAYGAVAKFMVERLAGLKRAEAGWKRARTEPEVGGDFTWARAEHLTPYGRIASSWRLEGNEGNLTLTIDVVVPPTTEMEVVIPGDEPRTEIVGSGEWSFSVPFTRRYEWPVKPISAMPV
ncbi:hypothetical protein VdG2_05538 [Verticillium dahliae VDG2]|nr:hypothetical protein VdG2_05538 [Verticillium dahliae VDG2]